MEIKLTPEQEAFVRQAVAEGRLAREKDAVEQALGMWVERERRRMEILAALDEAEASLARGEGIEITPDSMGKLAADIKRRGRSRMSHAAVEEQVSQG